MTEPRSDRASLLVVEDEPHTRRRLAEAVNAMAEVELDAAVGSIADARARLAERLPDVLLTDLGLPDGSGIDLIREVTARGATSMVVTVFGDEKNVLRSIEAGASSYLLKDGSLEDIAKAVRQVLDGGAPISPSIARHLLRRFRAAGSRARDPGREGPAVELTDREAEVLALIAKGFTFAEIAAVLTISVHTVTTHVRKIYKKLAVGSRGEAVYEALQLGLIDVD